MRILVTGSHGFIGGHLLPVLDGHEVLPFDRKRGQQIALDFEFVAHTYKPDLVVHLAAKVGREFGEESVHGTVRQNTALTALVAQWCGETNTRLAYASTSEVYGDNGQEACDEETGPFALPHNTYGLSKKHGEDYCRLYAPEGLVIWRISMPFGPGLPPGRGRAAMVNFLYNALHRQPITVHQGSERSWCWIGDTVKGMALTLGTDGGTFNIGRDDNALTMLTLAHMCCDLVGAPEDLIQLVTPPERQTVVKRLSTDRLRALGWQPETSLLEGMERTLAWVKTLPAPALLAA